MQKTILKVLTTFCKFVSHHFKKEGHTLLIADVPIIGQFVCHHSEDKTSYDFIPSNQMQMDCMLPRKPVDWNASEVFRKELTVGKIAEVCQLGID